MPKVFLSAAEREAAREDAELATLAELIRTSKGRTGKRDQDTADEVGVSKASFCGYKRSVNGISLRTARRIAHAVGCTREQWLRIGGFK